MSPPREARSRLDAITTLGRDVNNAIVVDDQFASAQHAVLTFRGRTWYVEDLNSTNGTFVNGQPVEGASPLGLRRRDPDRPGPVPARAAATVTANAPSRCPGSSARSSSGRRWREARLLAIVAAAILVGSVSLELARRTERDSWRRRGFSPAEPLHLAIYLGVLLGAHLAQVLTGRRTDQVLLPAVGLLGGISLLLMERLPQDLVVQRFFGAELGLADVQLVWLVLVDQHCRRPSPSSSAPTAGCASTSTRGRPPGVALLLLTFVLGTEINGQRLTLSFGPVSGQPSELLKVILVVFLAGYLSENRSLLVEESTGSGRSPSRRCRTSRRWSRCGRSPSGSSSSSATSAPRCCSSPCSCCCLYAATARPGYVVLGVLLFLAGGFVMYQLVPHVQTRVNIWLDPFADPATNGYQIIQALYAFGRGGLARDRARAPGCPTTIPAVETDFPLAALGEELGLVGVMAILGIYLVVIERGLRIGASAGDDFRSLLAAGLALVVGVQAFIIAAGQPQAHPADRHHAAVHQLRRLVDARQRNRRRPAPGPVRQGRRAAAGAEAARPAAPG